MFTHRIILLLSLWDSLQLCQDSITAISCETQPGCGWSNDQHCLQCSELDIKECTKACGVVNKLCTACHQISDGFCAGTYCGVSLQQKCINCNSLDVKTCFTIHNCGLAGSKCLSCETLDTQSCQKTVNCGLDTDNTCKWCPIFENADQCNQSQTCVWNGDSCTFCDQLTHDQCLASSQCIWKNNFCQRGCSFQLQEDCDQNCQWNEKSLLCEDACNYNIQQTCIQLPLCHWDSFKHTCNDNCERKISKSCSDDINCKWFEGNLQTCKKACFIQTNEECSSQDSLSYCEWIETYDQCIEKCDIQNQVDCLKNTNCVPFTSQEVKFECKSGCKFSTNQNSCINKVIGKCKWVQKVVDFVEYNKCQDICLGKNQLNCQADETCKWFNRKCNEACYWLKDEKSCLDSSYCKWDSLQCHEKCEMRSINSCLAVDKCTWIISVNQCQDMCNSKDESACKVADQCKWIENLGCTDICPYRNKSTCLMDKNCKWNEFSYQCEDACFVNDKMIKCSNNDTCRWSDDKCIDGCYYKDHFSCLQDFNCKWVSEKVGCSDSCHQMTKKQCLLDVTCQWGINALEIETCDDQCSYRNKDRCNLGNFCQWVSGQCSDRCTIKDTKNCEQDKNCRISSVEQVCISICELMNLEECFDEYDCKYDLKRKRCSLICSLRNQSLCDLDDTCQWDGINCVERCPWKIESNCSGDTKCLWKNDACQDKCAMRGNQSLCISDGDCLWVEEKCSDGCQYRKETDCSIGKICSWDSQQKLCVNSIQNNLPCTTIKAATDILGRILFLTVWVTNMLVFITN